MKPKTFLTQINNFMTQKNKRLSISYLTLRRWIGILGIVLPFASVLGGLLFSRTPVQGSISSYYYTNMRDIFVGVLCIVSLFLITYDGYNRTDKLVTTFTGVFGFGVALFPCSTNLVKVQKVGIFQLDMPVSGIFHLVSATLFLTLLGLTSIFLFTRSDKEDIGGRKRIRNRVYIICGIIMLLSISGAAVCILIMTGAELEKYKAILICETIGLMAFGLSWLTKGETLWKDEVQEPTNSKTRTAKGLLNSPEIS